MTRIPPVFALLALLAAPVRQARPQETRGSTCVAVTGARAVHLGTGAVLEGATIVIRNGLIEAVGRVDVPAGATVIDAEGGVVIPSLVDAGGDVSADGSPSEESVAADVFAADGFDLFADRSRDVEGGVLHAFVTVGGERLIGGWGAVACLAGEPASRILVPRSSLEVTLGESVRRQPRIFEPPVHPSPADRPVPPARPQLPGARMGAILALRSAFDAARTAADPPAAIREILPALSGAHPVRVRCHRAADIARAIDLSRDYGFRLIIEGGTEAHLLADDLAAVGAAVVLRPSGPPGVYGRSMPGGFQPDGVPDPEGAAILSRAGVRLAVAAPGAAEVGELLWYAGWCMRGGLAESAALRAVTLDAARILGIAERTGSLETGREGNLVILADGPFVPGAAPRRVLLRGETVYRRDVRSDLTAVVVDRILAMDGSTADDGGVILIEEGRIVAVGPDVAVPRDATVLRFDGGVATPGFIDSSSLLGIRSDTVGEEGEVRSTALDRVVDMQDSPADLIMPGDPAFAPARAAGVTTVILAPGGGQTVSGRAAAVKTAGRKREDVVLEATAGIRLDLSTQSLSRSTLDSLRTTLENGRKYAEEWRKYEEALKTGSGAPAAETPRRRVTTPVGGTGDPVSGRWEGEVRVVGFPRPIPMTLELHLEGQVVSGTVSSRLGGGESRPITEGRFEDGKLRLVLESEMGRAVLEGTISDDELTGEIRVGDVGGGTITAKRVERFAGEAPASETRSAAESRPEAAAASRPAAPNEPKKDPALEPWRRAFAGRCPVIVSVRGERFAAAVLELLTELKVSVVLSGADEVHRFPDALTRSAASVLVGPTVTADEEGRRLNPAAFLTRRGIPVAFQSRSAEGSADLARTAAFAVHHGMDGGEALRALTVNAARMFGLADRIGTLARGRDADIVVFDGPPLHPSTRVVAVLVNGRLVHRKE